MNSSRRSWTVMMVHFSAPGCGNVQGSEWMRCGGAGAAASSPPAALVCPTRLPTDTQRLSSQRLFEIVRCPLLHSEVHLADFLVIKRLHVTMCCRSLFLEFAIPRYSSEVSSSQVSGVIHFVPPQHSGPVCGKCIRLFACAISGAVSVSRWATSPPAITS